MSEEKPKQATSKFTAVRMGRRLYAKARRKARSRHQTFSEYVRQLIVSDTAETEPAP
jgi:hypothetical protein